MKKTLLPILKKVGDGEKEISHSKQFYTVDVCATQKKTVKLQDSRFSINSAEGSGLKMKTSTFSQQTIVF